MKIGIQDHTFVTNLNKISKRNHFSAVNFGHCRNRAPSSIFKISIFFNVQFRIQSKTNSSVDCPCTIKDDFTTECWLFKNFKGMSKSNDSCFNRNIKFKISFQTRKFTRPKYYYRQLKSIFERKQT